MSLNLTAGKIVGLICLAAGAAKMLGLMPLKLAAADLFLAGLLSVAVLP